MVIIVQSLVGNIIMVLEQQSQFPGMPLEDFVRHFLDSLTLGIDIAVGVIIAISIIRGFIMYVKTDTKISARANKRRGRHKALCRKQSHSCPRPRSR